MFKNSVKRFTITIVSRIGIYRFPKYMTKI